MVCVTHSNALLVAGICFHESVLMLIQEFLPDSLDAFVERQPSGPGLDKDVMTFYRIAAAICEVLCYLHGRNIAHRDLKVRAQGS
jgi:serine/threonine protein kinase